MLHITNGDSAGGSLRTSGLGGEVLAWRDVLHDGPVPAGEDAATLRQTRARFIADAGWGRYNDVLTDFTARDATLESHATQGDELVLWFEHDLYDQLQLIQVLDRLADTPGAVDRASLICIGEHPEVQPFHGLGELRPDQLAALFPQRQPVSQAHLALARDAWAAFRAPDPSTIVRLLAGDTDALPYLVGALERHLEDFPSAEDGLSRTEWQILETVATGAATPAALFKAHYAQEARPFMGDWSFFARVGALASVTHPALAREDGAPLHTGPQQGAATGFAGQRLTLTAVGRGLLEGREDWVRLNGLDRWFGGVHLTGQNAPWRWSRAQRRLVAAA
jgi:hypothetical protein